MEVRNYLPEEHPYKKSKTKAQWQKEKRALNEGVIGRRMWHNRFCQASGFYFLEEETHPALAEEIRAWQDEKRKAGRERYAKKKAKRERLKKEAEEKASKLEKDKEKEREKKNRLFQIDKAKLICLDIETTGLYSGVDELLQLSMIDGNGKALFNKYIRPKEIVTWPEAECIHGISPQMVADKPTIDSYIDQVNTLIEGAELLIGYNILQFDLEFLRCAGIIIPDDIEVYDVMLEFAPIYGEWSECHQNYTWQKLSVCAGFYEYNGTGEYHNSLEDVKATLHCFFKMIKDEK